MIVPRDFPELSLIAWNRDITRPIATAEAYALYEAHWRHIDAARMTPAESALVEALTQAFGRGALLTRGQH